MKSNENHIFIDTNIIVGAFSEGKEFAEERQCWSYLTSLVGKKIYISSLSVAQFISILQHHKINKNLLKQHVNNILAKTIVIDFTRNDIEASLNMKESDLEDNIQYVLAKKLKCGVFFTQNKKHYKDYMYTDVYTAKEYTYIAQY